MNSQKNISIKNLNQILELAEGLVKKNGPYTVALAAGDDIVCVGGLELAKNRGLIKPILVGHRRRIDEVFEKLNLSQNGWDIEADKDPKSATRNCAEMILRGDADILMRGRLMARDFLKALLEPGQNLRNPESLWTNVVVVDNPKIDRLLLINDCGIIVSADLPHRVRQITKVYEFANFLGIKEVKIALLAAVETISPGMPTSLEEAVISKMCERGQFPVGVAIDGPLSLDLAISPEAVKKKRFRGNVAGNADILVVNHLGIGNLLFKSLITLCGSKSSSVIIGLPFPVVFTSRSETPENILYSLALAILQTGDKNKINLLEKDTL